jgi:hypothetical protein
MGGGFGLTHHQSRDTETDGQHNTCDDGLSGCPSALLEISFFKGECSTPYFTINILCLGKTTNSQDQFPVIRTVSLEQICLKTFWSKKPWCGLALLDLHFLVSFGLSGS